MGRNNMRNRGGNYKDQKKFDRQMIPEDMTGE